MIKGCYMVKKRSVLVLLFLLICLVTLCMEMPNVLGATRRTGSWVKSSNGRWWYRFDDGSFQAGKWLSIGGNWYHFDENGWMQIGWILDNNKWYYLNQSGVMQTGWILDNNKWYHLNQSGAMQTGWIKDKNKWYYLNSTGAMKIGWLKNKNGWYYLDDSGAMNTGKVLINGNLYFMDNSGMCLNPDKDISFLQDTENGYRKYFKGIRTSDYIVFNSDGSITSLQNELTIDVLCSLNLDNADKNLDSLDEKNSKEGFKRLRDPHIFTYYYPDDRFPVIYGVVYTKSVLDKRIGFGGKTYIRIYRLDTGDLVKEYEDLLK